MEFHYISPQDNCAVAQISIEYNIEFVDEISSSSNPVIFKLGRGVLEDVMANDLGWPLFSKRLKDIIDECTYDQEYYIWNEVVIESNEHLYKYFVPQFTSSMDVLNTDATIFASDDFVVKACLDPLKVEFLDFFPVPGSDSRIIISGKILNAILAKSFNTCSFELVSLSQVVQH